MAVRFRKSVKICKGVKVNFSKSGASLSLGGRGHGVTFGGSGTHAHVGIPGTGLSYNTKSGVRSRSHSHSRSSSRSTSGKPTVQVPKQIGIRMDDKGKVIIDGEEIALTAGDWVRIAPVAKRQFFAAEDEGISFVCIQTKENSLEGFTADDAVVY